MAISRSKKNQDPVISERQMRKSLLVPVLLCRAQWRFIRNEVQIPWSRIRGRPSVGITKGPLEESRY